MMGKQHGYGVTIDGQFFPITSRKSWETLRKAMDQYVDLLDIKAHLMAGEPADTFDADNTPVKANLARTKHVYEPGTRAIDALLIAMLDNGGELTRLEAPAAVAKYGWDTSSSVRPSVMIGVRASRYPQWVMAAGGKFTLTPEGRSVAQQIKATLRANATEREGEETPTI